MEDWTEKGDATGRRCCCGGDPGGAVAAALRQTLPEMEFERGIWYAAQNNDVERVERLLEKGISSNAEDGAGYTALHYASRGGHSDVCEILLKNGANVDATTRSGKATSLHRSSARGLDRVVELLLKSGADPNIRDSDGYTALHRAVLSSASPSVCSLLIPVTDLSIRDQKSRDVFQLAREINNPRIIPLFEKYERS